MKEVILAFRKETQASFILERNITALVLLMLKNNLAFSIFNFQILQFLKNV